MCSLTGGPVATTLSASVSGDVSDSPLLASQSETASRPRASARLVPFRPRSRRYDAICPGTVARVRTGPCPCSRLRSRPAGICDVFGRPRGSRGIDGRCRRECSGEPHRRHRSRDPWLATARVRRHALPRSDYAQRRRRLARGRRLAQHTICRLVSTHRAYCAGHGIRAVASPGSRLTGAGWASARKMGSAECAVTLISASGLGDAHASAAPGTPRIEKLAARAERVSWRPGMRR